MPIAQTVIRFPEIELRTRDAHKLRGYFGNLFREKSALLHNHMEGGEFKYGYPKVQYKVIDSTPTLVGIADGAGRSRCPENVPFRNALDGAQPKESYQIQRSESTGKREVT